MKQLLPYDEAAEYIGIKPATLYKLMRRGEIFPDSKKPNPHGVGAPILMFDTEDLDLIKEQFYRKPDPNIYIVREKAAAYIHMNIKSLREHNDELAPKYAFENGKKHVFYPKDKLLALRKRLDAERTAPKGYAKPQEMVGILGACVDTIRKYAKREGLPFFRNNSTGQTYYPKDKLLALRPLIEQGKIYMSKRK